MINDILRRTTNTQAAVFTEKYDRANGTTSRKKKKSWISAVVRRNFVPSVDDDVDVCHF